MRVGDVIAEIMKRERVTMLFVYHTQLFAAFVGTLANVPDGDGSILDRSLIL